MNTWNIEKLAKINEEYMMKFRALVTLRSIIEQGRADAPSDTNRELFLRSFEAVSLRFAAHVADRDAFATVLRAAASKNSTGAPIVMANLQTQFDDLKLQGHHLITEHDAQMQQEAKLFPTA